MRASSFVFMMLLGWQSLAAAGEPANGEPAKADLPEADPPEADPPEAEPPETDPPETEPPEAAAKVAAAKVAFDADGCEAPTRLCLDRDGRLLATRPIPELEVGEALEVRVYSTNKREPITITITTAKSITHLTEPTRAETSPSLVNSLSKGTSPQFYLVHALTSPAVTDDVDHLLVTVIHTADNTAQPPIVVPVVGARHYVEFGAALFAVLGGNRVVTSPATTTSDLQPSGAFVVTLFAGARPDRQIGFGLWHRNAWALQLGTDFNLSQAVDQKEYYVGAAWSPLKGITLSGGLGFVHGQFLSAGLATPDLDNEAMPGFTEHYMYRPYVGVTLTPQVVDSLKAALGQVQGALGH